MEYRRDYKVKNKSRKRTTLKYKRYKSTYTLVGGIGALCLAVGLYFGTDIFSDPGVDVIALAPDSSQYRKEVVLAENSISQQVAGQKEENQSTNTGGTSGGSQHDYWDNLSGYYWGDYPMELFTLSTCSERGSSDAAIHECWGDHGQAYSLMQLDYRYDLVPFMQQSYAANSEAWKGFAHFLDYKPKDSRLVYNRDIVNAFNYCYDNYPTEYMKTQPNFMVEEYLYTKPVQDRLDAAGIKLEEHSVYVSAALLSCNINCGYVTGTKNFIAAGARNDMTDEELLNCVYTGWRMYRKKSSWSKHGARLALDKSGEEGMALALLHGESATTFDNSKTCSWGAGWDGPNSTKIAYRR